MCMPHWSAAKWFVELVCHVHANACSVFTMKMVCSAQMMCLLHILAAPQSLCFVTDCSCLPTVISYFYAGHVARPACSLIHVPNCCACLPSRAMPCRAVLCCAVLCCAVLCCAVLGRAELCCAMCNNSCCDMFCTDLTCDEHHV